MPPMRHYTDWYLDNIYKGIEASFNHSKLVEARNLLADAGWGGKNIYLCGNGGSAATASHFANDLLKVAKMRAICLNDQVPTMLAYMNDDGVTAMFSSQIGVHSRPGDVLVAISCSGQSMNVVNAAERMKKFDNKVIALTGEKHSPLSELADIVLPVNHTDIRIQEDVHMIFCHAVIHLLVTPKDES